MKIALRISDRSLERAFGDFQRKQLPFALALTATNLAKGAQAAERDLIKATFDSATPFTLNSIAVRPATKAKPIATVFAKDIAAAYLQPFTSGGTHFLGTKKGLLVPKGQPVNQYGNLPKGKVKALLGRPDVFVGPVTFKRSGQTVNGIWQRPPAGKRRDGSRGTKGATQGKIGAVRTGLKLLIRFEDALPVKERLDFQGRAEAYVRKNAGPEFTKAFAQAMASAR